MRKTSTIAIAILLVLAAIVAAFNVRPAFSNPATLYGMARIDVSPPDARGNINDALTFNVAIENVANMGGYEFKLYWNTSILTCTQWNYTSKRWITDASTPPYTSYFTAVNNITTLPDGRSRLWIALGSLSLPPEKSGSFSVAMISLKIIAAGQTLLDLQDTLLSNPYNINDGIPHIASDGFVTTPLTRTILIDSSGNVDPPGALTRTGTTIYTYTFPNNININYNRDGIVVERDNIIINGANFRLQGSGNGIGITLQGRTNVTIKNLKIQSFGFGVKLTNSIKNMLTTNNVTSNSFWGINLRSSSNNTITQNTIMNNKYGLFAYNASNYNNVARNTVKTNSEYGILVDYVSTYNSIDRNNIFTNANYGIGIYDSVRNMLTVNNVTSSNFLGVLLGHSAYTMASANNITSNRNHGIILTNSANSTITGNKITNQLIGTGSGITVSTYSTNNNITMNTLTYNIRGIRVELSANNKISRNIVKSCSQGVSAEGASDNTLFNNNFTKCGTNLYLDATTNNKFYYNNFLTPNVTQITSMFSVNTWDNGYPSGGNYWSDYVGADANNDGIGDTPYTIDYQNSDRYPLKVAVALHNIAVTKVTTSKTIVGQGFTLRVNATIVNRGYSTETFQLKFYANAIVITTISNINLQAAYSTVISYVWNTTGLAKTNYLVKGEVPQVLGETYTADNIFNDGTVKVTKKGDVNGDNNVNVLDLITAASALGTKPGDAKWNPNADINSDTSVNVLDLILIANYLGT